MSPSVRGGDGDHLENYLQEMLQSADGLTVDDIQSRFLASRTIFFRSFYWKCSSSLIGFMVDI